MEGEIKRLQQENLKLLVDACAARAYRDELDALRERAIKADKLESEVARYREQMHKMEFYKAKVEKWRRGIKEACTIATKCAESCRTRVSIFTLLSTDLR
ncbi:girdin-like [Stigmatopora argus]